VLRACSESEKVVKLASLTGRLGNGKEIPLSDDRFFTVERDGTRLEFNPLPITNDSFVITLRLLPHGQETGGRMAFDSYEVTIE
jgi:hypothetical protein